MQQAASRMMSPKYYLLKQDLITKIDGRQFAEGNPIPSERELVQQYHVSRITVRRAIDELVREGYLYKVQGRGTFVKTEEFSQDLVCITSCTQDVINLGMTPRRKVLASEVIDPDEARRRALELGPNDRVFHLERIYYADDMPINLTSTYLPYKLFLGIDSYDFSNESLYDIIEREYSVHLTNATRSIEAVLARGEVAEHLEVKAGTPILYFGCVTHAEVRGKQLPIENFDCFYRSDKFKFYINQRAI